MEFFSKWKDRNSYSALCGGRLSHPPFLFRNMRYVRDNRRDAEDEKHHRGELGPLLRVRLLDVPAPPGTNIRLWIVASKLQDCAQQKASLGLAVRDFRSQSAGVSPSGLFLVPSSCVIDLSLASAYAESHNLLLRLEVYGVAGDVNDSAPPLLIGETVLHGAGRCTCAQQSLQKIKLRPPGPEHKLPRPGFLLSDMPAIVEAVSGTFNDRGHRAAERCDIDQSKQHWQSTSNYQRVEGLSLKSLELDGANAKDEGAPRESHGPSALGSGSQTQGPALDGGYASLETRIDPGDGQCALSYRRDDTAIMSLQVYTPPISKSSFGFVRPDFVCPLCLRFCRRLSTMVGHFESYHESLVPSLIIIPMNNADVECVREWMPAGPMVVLHFTLTERQSMVRMLRGTMFSKNAGDCSYSNRESPALDGTPPSRRRNPRRIESSESMSADDEPGLRDGLSLIHRARSAAPYSSPEIEGPSGLEGGTVLFVNTTRFPSWHVPLIDWDATVRRERTEFRKGSHSVVSRAHNFKSATRGVVEQMPDAESDSTLPEEDEMDGLKRLWSRCRQCDTLHASAYAHDPEFCCQTCHMLHKSSSRLPAVPVLVERLLKNPPLSTLASNMTETRSRVSFESAFRNKTMFHLVSVARFDAEHFDENDKDSEEEVDFSWRRQLNVEEIEALNVRPKQKVLWTMWNRFAFDKMAAGEYAERYTRYSLELFTTLYRSELLRLGLRVELMAFIRALHVHGCIDGTAVISALKCLDGQKTVSECSESMLPKGIDVEGLKAKRLKGRANGRGKLRKGKRN
jgi:hypothetical protein